ncbi:MAG: hypothetical protein AB1791_10275 [Chloroflexota bacterium]
MRTNQVIVAAATQRAAGTATAAYQISLWTATPTFTATPTPTPTSTDTPTPTPTATDTTTPTATPTPTPTTAPCSARLRPDVEDPRLYAQASAGRTMGSVPLNPGDSVLLWARLDQEPWWLASRSSSGVPEGWLRADAIGDEAGCQSLPTLPLTAVAGSPVSVLAGTLPQAVVADTFSTQNYRWLDGEGQPMQAVRQPLGDLVLSLPKYGLSLARLSNQTLPGTFDLYANLRRASQVLEGSYIAVRLVSERMGDSAYVEIRFDTVDCAYSYHVFEDGKEKWNAFPPPLEDEANCTSRDDHFLFLAADLDPVAEKITLHGSYNGFSLQAVPVEDSQGIFQTTTLVLVSNTTALDVEYVLVIEPTR